MVEDNRRWKVGRLGGVPVLDGAVEAGLQRGVELVVLRDLAEVIQPGFIAESHQPGGVGVQRFGKSVRAASSRAWMMPLARMPGYRLRASEIAAIAIATTAAVVGSMSDMESGISVAVVEKNASTWDGCTRYLLCSHLCVWTIRLTMANT